ncbi:MarR family winged helix-turn-helix transcriptional regulator [Cryobacterium sp. TMT4-31]|uniref:MarR family winged helix-turn-helix transcriptional regulator n=1 Tax=Cryobacterium sp. TMT4-31 TaxID=1259259 RepID=UPI00141A8B6D|nr:MarR family transcriptional regulator [Cryobacterium sp. TMT4-31]
MGLLLCGENDDRQFRSSLMYTIVLESGYDLCMAEMHKTAPLEEISRGTQDFGWALGTLLREYLRGIEHVVQDLPGGPRAYQVMTIVAGGTCQNQAAIAERLGIDRTITTHLLDGLEAQNLITRTPDPLDRRGRRVALTAQGVEKLAMLTNHAESVEHGLLASLSEIEASALRMNLRLAAETVGSRTGTGGTACNVVDDLGLAG